jgi:hypothetical protein
VLADSPALAASSSALYVAFRASDGSNDLVVASSPDGVSFPTVKKYGGIALTNNPALVHTATPAASGGFTTTTGTNPSLTYKVSDTDAASTHVLGTTFGGSYYAEFEATATKYTATNGLGASAQGILDFPVILFGDSVHLFTATANATVRSDQPTQFNATYAIDVLGSIARSGSQSFSLTSPITSTPSWSFSGVLGHSIDIEYEIGPIPVTISAAATGTVGLNQSVNFTFTTTNGALSYNLTPSAQLSAGLSVTAGGVVDGVGAEASLEGELTLIEASLPMQASVVLSATNATISAGATATVSAFSGYVDLNGKVCLGECWSYTENIFDWNGLSYTNQSLWTTTAPYPYAW